MTIIELKEYEKLPPSESNISQETAAKLKKLENLILTEQDQKLKQELQEKKILSITSEPLQKGLRFSAQSHIGVAQFTNFAVTISPKFSNVEKLVELIDYVYDLDLEIFPESETEFEGEKDRLSEIIISTFVKKCQKLLRQGMVKSYNMHEDNLPYIRGKLLIRQQILNDAHKVLQFVCEHDELEYDNLENQILLYCLKRCYYITKNNERKKDIRRLIQNFADLVKYKEITLNDFKKINYNQMNFHYRKVHELCKLIVNSIRITDFYEQKTRFVNSFFVDMNIVFQKFVYKIFHQYYFPISFAIREQQHYKSWRTGDGNIIESIPDILVYDKKKQDIEIIIDTKYKDRILENDLYQIEHYVRDLGKEEGYAILPESPDPHTDEYQSIKQKLAIHIRFINIDKMLELIFLKDQIDKKKRIQDELSKLISI